MEFEEDDPFFDDEGFPTLTSEEQMKTERKVSEFFDYYARFGKNLK